MGFILIQTYLKIVNIIFNHILNYLILMGICYLKFNNLLLKNHLINAFLNHST